MKVTKYTTVNKGYIVAKIDVEIPEWHMQIRDLTLFQKNGRRWINMPQRKYDDNGETKYFHYIRFTENDVKERFDKAVIDAVEQYAAENNKQELEQEQQQIF